MSTIYCPSNTGLLSSLAAFVEQLAFTFTVAEVGGNIAVLDAAEELRKHFYQRDMKHGTNFKYYG